jgi:hypothetical protein
MPSARRQRRERSRAFSRCSLVMRRRPAAVGSQSGQRLPTKKN